MNITNQVFGKVSKPNIPIKAAGMIKINDWNKKDQLILFSRVRKVMLEKNNN